MATFAAGVEVVTTVRQPVEGSTCQAFAAENLRPMLERQVVAHAQAGSLAGGTDDIRSQLAGGKGHQSILDRLVELGKLVVQPRQLWRFN